MANKLVQRRSPSLAISETQTDAAMRRRFTPARTAGTGRTASVGEDVDKSKLSCASGGNVNRCTALDNGPGGPRTLNAELPCDAALSLRGTHPREMETCPRGSAPSFPTAEREKHPNVHELVKG